MMKAYRGKRGTAPLMLNLNSAWKWLVAFTLWGLYPCRKHCW